MRSTPKIRFVVFHDGSKNPPKTWPAPPGSPDARSPRQPPAAAHSDEHDGSGMVRRHHHPHHGEIHPPQTVGPCTNVICYVKSR